MTRYKFNLIRGDIFISNPDWLHNNHKIKNDFDVALENNNNNNNMKDKKQWKRNNENASS